MRSREQLNFDRAALLTELSTVSARKCLVFALAASTRSFRYYESFCKRAKWGDADAMREVLTFAWGCVEEGKQKKTEVRDHAKISDRLARMKPRDGFGWDYSCASYAASGAASCLDFLSSTDRKYAAAAAECSFDVTYRFAGYVLHRHLGQHKSTAELRRQKLEYQAVQVELMRQRADLDDIHEIKASGQKQVIKKIRIRAEQQAKLPAEYRKLVSAAHSRRKRSSTHR